MIKPQDYRASKQVRLVVEMIQAQRVPHAGVGESERRFQDGTRHGLNITLRALVELETNITDPEDLDGLCADLIEDAMANRC